MPRANPKGVHVERVEMDFKDGVVVVFETTTEWTLKINEAVDINVTERTRLRSGRGEREVAVRHQHLRDFPVDALRKLAGEAREAFGE